MIIEPQFIHGKTQKRKKNLIELVDRFSQASPSLVIAILKKTYSYIKQAYKNVTIYLNHIFEFYFFFELLKNETLRFYRKRKRF